MPANRAEAAQAKYRGRMRLWWVFLVLSIVSVIGTLTVYLVMAFGFFKSIAATLERLPHSSLREGDSEILLRVRDLLEDDEIPILGPGENAGREPRPDRGWVIFAEGEGRAGGREIRVHCSAHFARDPTTARETYTYLTAADNPGRRFVDRFEELVFSPVLTTNRFRWGDESDTAILLDGKDAVGIQFTALTGDRVYHLAVVGRDLSDPNLLRMILLPKLERFAIFEP